MVAGLDPQRNQRSGNLVHILPELGIGSGIVQGSVLEAVLIRITLCHLIQNLREGQINDIVLLPGEGAGFAAVVVNRTAALFGGSQPLHEADEMGQNNILRGNILIPIHAEESVVVQGLQGIHKVFHRKIAISQEYILAALTVSDTDIADVGAEGLNSGIGILLAPEIGFPDIPAHAQCGAAKQIDDIQRTLRMGKIPHGFQQNGYSQPLSTADGGG